MGWTPEHWASRVPFGIGQQRPNNYFEIVRAVGENRDRLGYAWRILSQGVCDGCALGTTGMRDWTLDGPHLCNIRLRLLRLNTMPAMDHDRLGDVEGLRGLSSGELRELGRLAHPMVRRAGEPGFTRLSWDEALELVAARVRATHPDRTGWYLTSRGMPNESYYAVQKAVRAIGTNNIDNAARVCHAPSTVALKETVGAAASTCSYRDWIGSDLVVFVGSNVANNQPVATKYLHHAVKAGTRVVCVNTYEEPGMARYWVPSVPESALFGTRITDRFFLVHTGGDAAFLTGALKRVVERDAVDREFVAAHTRGFDEVAAHVRGLDWGVLEQASGASRGDMEALGDLLAEARSAVLVWSMGVTQLTCGEDNVRAIVNLALARGFVGRDHCGLMPIRGHSGVQGGAEMGAYASALPGGVPVGEEEAERLARRWGFPVPHEPGLTAPEMLDACADGRLDVLFSAGGNFLEVLPDPAGVEAALGRVPLRVHMDIVPTSQMLVDPADAVVLLPAATRYEIPGGVTETSTERRVIFSPEVPGPRPGEARPEWEVLGALAARVRPELADLVRFPGTPAIREEIAAVVPMYEGIQRLVRQGDQFQYGGPHLCAGGRFPTPDGRGRFSVVEPPAPRPADGRFTVSTRRGKQFNSIVHASHDAITGAGRDDVLMSLHDATALDLADGDAIVLRNEFGELAGRVRTAPLRPGNLQVHWPEGNVLLDGRLRSAQAGIPQYAALVEVVRVDDVHSAGRS